jgi:hypothetical protein
MHFGPEWMRKQPTPAPCSSLTESTTAGLGLDPTAPTPPTPSYSASVAFGVVNSEKWDGGHPLRYSEEEMILVLPVRVDRGRVQHWTTIQETDLDER